jgi:RNA polymerase sigma-70 factor (ECF subfamily)
LSTPGSSTESHARFASDAALVAGLRAGEEGAFEHLVRTYGGRLLAVTRRLLGHEEDARDAVQETFLRAFRSLGSFEGGSLLSTWLHRIAVNTALMKLRSRKRKPEEPIEGLLPAFRDDGHFSERFQAWTEAPDEEAARREHEQMVRRAIDRLPEQYRTVLLLRDIEELGTAEVADQLGVTPNAVKLRLHRARQALRTLLAPQFRSPSR